MGLRSGDAKRPEFVPLDRFPGFESVAAYPNRPWKHNSNRGEGHRRKSFFRRLLESFISEKRFVRGFSGYCNARPHQCIKPPARLSRHAF